MVTKDTLLRAFDMMCNARAMAETYDANRQICKYVHSTSKGHEAIQLATGMQLKPHDYAAPYYRDESMLLGMGMTPYELMLQLLAKADDPFSGGRTYYAHPSLNRPNMPKMPHQSSATGMQAIPATGMAHGVQYLEKQGLLKTIEKPVVLCSLGDGSVTEGEVAEAFQMAVLADLPVLYLIQDNDWGISASIDGSDFVECYEQMGKAIEYVRTKRKPLLVHVKVPLLGHHTSGVRKEWYRSDEDMAKHTSIDPFPRLKKLLLELGESEASLEEKIENARTYITAEFERAVNSPDPDISTAFDHEFAPTPITEEKGERTPEGKDPIIMVDAALFAMDEILRTHPEALFYGQDVGGRLGGVFREAATLAGKYGDNRVFNTPIQEAYIVGSTAGMSAVGVKPIVEIQFADYIWPGVNQLVTELSKSCYLTMGKYPVSAVIRIPTGAYGGGGPYHSGTVESSILQIKGIKIVYPSNAADMKGLLKAAYYDPNPVIVFEHKGIYWSKMPGTEAAKAPEPSEDYVIPLGKARIVQHADKEMQENGESVAIITYGMGVYWALLASKKFAGQVEILDLRTLNPCDEEAIQAAAKRHGKVLVLTEETLRNSFAEAIAGRIGSECFQYLDAPVQTLGSANMPAIPLNMALESQILPNPEKVAEKIEWLLNY
jgi:2-oxoisovalerate dehydrogenase E1 component